tara:strand:- start:596 stop:2260 length:1665 start_codon:yes stop_codon:yes gene_type:complete
MANTKVGGNQLRLTDSHALTGSAVAPSVLVDLASAQTREGSSIAAGLFFSGSVRLSAAPTHKQDAATKVYVDSVAGGGVTTNQLAWGNADGTGVESASSLWYSDGASILYASGSILSPSFTSAAAMDISSTGALTIDSVGADNVSIGHEAAAKTIQLGNAASTAVNLDALAVTVTSVNALALTDGTATFQLAGSGATSLAAATTVDLDSTGIMSLNSTAAINVGDDAVAAKISVGGDATTRTEVELNAIVVDINAGATGVTIDALDAGTIGIGTSAAVGSTTSAVNVGTSATARTITIGADQSTKVDVNALIIELDSAGTIVLNSATTTDVDSTGILSLNSAAAINIGNDAVAQAINIGSGAAARAIQVGNAASTSVDHDALRITATSVHELTMSAGTVLVMSGATTHLSGTSSNTYGVGVSFMDSAKHIFQHGGISLMELNASAGLVVSPGSLSVAVNFSAAAGVVMPANFWLTGSATGNGTNAAFEIGSGILNSLAPDDDSVKVHLNGIRQLAGSADDYMLSSSLLSAQRFIKFNTAPVSGDVVVFDYSRIT